MWERRPTTLDSQSYVLFIRRAQDSLRIDPKAKEEEVHARSSNYRWKGVALAGIQHRIFMTTPTDKLRARAENLHRLLVDCSNVDTKHHYDFHVGRNFVPGDPIEVNHIEQALQQTRDEALEEIASKIEEWKMDGWIHMAAQIRSYKSQREESKKGEE